MMTIHIAFDGLSGVDGSARFSFGTTTAIASVSGPITARLAAEHPVRATIDVHVRPLSSVSSTTEKHTAIILKGILERACILSQHPRSSIQVVVQALSPSLRASDSTDVDLRLAAEINACSLALLNAGSVPMRGVVCAIAVTQATSTSEPQLVTGPGSAGTTHPACTGCFAFLFGTDNNLSMGQSGTCAIPRSKMIWTNYRACPGNSFSVEALRRVEDVALEGTATVWTEMKKSLSASSLAGDG